VPLSGGLVGFVALRCYAEERAFSLSTQAQDHVPDLAEYKRVEPAHCPTGATSGGAGCERNLLWAYHPFLFAHAPCPLHDWVFELDLTWLVKERSNFHFRGTIAHGYFKTATGNPSKFL
jgi:hypothetical protein